MLVDLKSCDSMLDIGHVIFEDIKAGFEFSFLGVEVVQNVLEELSVVIVTNVIHCNVPLPEQKAGKGGNLQARNGA